MSHHRMTRLVSNKHQSSKKEKMEKIVLIFIFLLVCHIFIFMLVTQIGQFSTGPDDGVLDEASLPGLHSQDQGGQFIENTDMDIGQCDVEDVSEEKQDDEEMKFNYPDYEENLSQHLYNGELK